jgi:archaellum biogenesis ATPase FlaH
MPNIHTPYRRKVIVSQKHSKTKLEKGLLSSRAMRPILVEAMIVFPNMENRAHEDTLNRIARHMRERAGQYEAFYFQFQNTIKPRHNANIAEHEQTLKEALRAVKALPKKPVNPEVVHDALRKVSAAAHAIIFLQQTEIEMLKSELAASKPTVLTSADVALVQTLRDEVRDMTFNQSPIDGIPLYRGLRGGDADAVTFFKMHYSKYTKPGQMVIFTSDLADIDPKLMTALRNQCREGMSMPLGSISDRTTAIIDRKFFDGKRAAQSARSAGWLRTRKLNLMSEAVHI